MRPDCLVLDEATAMLDPIGREKVMRTVHRLNREFGITVVQITHYMEEAATADRVIVMSEGKIALEGTPKEVFRQPAGAAAGRAAGRRAVPRADGGGLPHAGRRD